MAGGSMINNERNLQDLKNQRKYQWSQDKYGGIQYIDPNLTGVTAGNSVNPLSSQPKPSQMQNRNSTIVTEPQNKTLSNNSGAQSMNFS